MSGAAGVSVLPTEASRRKPLLPSLIWWRGDPSCEAARVGTVGNELKPAGCPAVIVRPETVVEVRAACRHAARHGLNGKARSGGHNWPAPFLRDGAMLTDLGALNAFEIDVSRAIATVGSALQIRQPQVALAPHGLLFPTGQCSSATVIGYLVQGDGVRKVPTLGSANNLIGSLAVVAHYGELIRASAAENADYFWAAHGAGAGFFGIVSTV